MLEIANVLQPLIDVFDAILQLWHGVTGSWGVAIVLLAFTLGLAFLPVTFGHWRSREKFYSMRPEVEQFEEKLRQLKETHKDDKDRLERERSRLMEEFGPWVSPLVIQVVLLPLLAWLAELLGAAFLFDRGEFASDVGADAPVLLLPDLAEPLTDHPFVLAGTMALFIAIELAWRAVEGQARDWRGRDRWIYYSPDVAWGALFLVLPAAFVLFSLALNGWGLGEKLALKRFYGPARRLYSGISTSEQ